jgi:2-iminobutanoate/2-iminopropanoate deaminase
LEEKLRNNGLTLKKGVTCMNVLETTKAPGAIGPYSQGFEVNGIVYTSGQIPVDPTTGNVPEGIAAQAEQSCKNVGAILEAAGVGFERVFKTTCFLADMGDFAAFNDVYAQYFVSKPARSCVAVKTLPKGVLCEIEAIAAK